jgi:translation initiation factor 2 alpha subunit (eIF-2alpha)
MRKADDPFGANQQAAHQAHRTCRGHPHARQLHRRAVSEDWLETLNTQAESTVTGYRITVRHLIELIGNAKLGELKVRDVDFAQGQAG